MTELKDPNKLRAANETEFTYAGLRVVMKHKYQGGETWNAVLIPDVEIYWKEQLLGFRSDLQNAISYVFHGIRTCRPDLVLLMGADRSAILNALIALSELVGSCDDLESKTPEISLRMQPAARSREKFPHWDQVPEVIVYSSVVTGFRGDYDLESINYRIVLSTSDTKLTHTVACMANDLPDVRSIIDDLVIKHFA